MKIIVLSWEYPPRIIGGIARHVAELYPELAKLGYEIHLITIAAKGSPDREHHNGLWVYRVSVPEDPDFLAWIRLMNVEMRRYVEALAQQLGDFALIHAHDWLVAEAAIALKHQFKLPLIVTIHATENGRQNGLHNPTHHYIHHQERNLAYQAWRIIVCTNYMRWEVNRTLSTPWDKIDVIFNGIRPDKKQQPFNFWEFRRRYAADDEKIIYYLGRMTYEKGIAVLIDAVKQVFEVMQGKARLILIGAGDIDRYKNQAQHLGILDRCHFTGFMPEAELDCFQTVADCAVFPSLYEPFGIVALESFAARVPVVVSDTGGMPEVVRHAKTGIVTRANNPQSLAEGILEVLKDPAYAQWLIDNAYKDLDVRFNWVKLAQQTEQVYQRVLAERAQVSWP